MANIIQAKGKLNGKIHSKESIKGSANPSSGARSYGDLPDKPSINGVEISGDKSAEDYGLKPSDFIVNITRDYIEDTVSADKTYNEISEAYNAGMDCYAEYESQKIPLYYLNPGAAIFIDESLRSITLTEIIIRSYGSVELNNSLFLPSEETYGLVKADKVTSDDTVPAKIGEDDKLYVPTYPTLESLNAQPKDFIVTISGDDVSGYTADKTYDEISEAYNAGKNCYANALGSKVPLFMVNEYHVSFLMGDPERFDILSISIYSEDNRCHVDITTSAFASATNPGIVYAQKATAQDTQPVNITPSTGFLYTAPPKFTFNLTVDTDTQTITADKTYTEIRAAYDAGRVIEGIVPILEDNPIQEMEVVRPDYGNNPKTSFELIVISDNKMTFYSTFYTTEITIDDTNTWTITY